MGHRLLDRRGGVCAPRSAANDRASGRGSTATTWADVVLAEDLDGQVPEPADPDHEDGALPDQRVALRVDRVVAGEARVGKWSEHGGRHSVGGHEVTSVRQQDVLARPPSWPRPQPTLPSRATQWLSRPRGSWGTRRTTRRRGPRRPGRRATGPPRRPQRPRDRRPRGPASTGGRTAGRLLRTPSRRGRSGTDRRPGPRPAPHAPEASGPAPPPARRPAPVGSRYADITPYGHEGTGGPRPPTLSR